MERRDFLRMAVGSFSLPLLGYSDGIAMAGAFYKPPPFDSSQIRWRREPYGADDAHIGTLQIEHYCKCGKRFDMIRVVTVTAIREPLSEWTKKTAVESLKTCYEEAALCSFIRHANCPLQPTVIVS